MFLLLLSLMTAPTEASSIVNVVSTRLNLSGKFNESTPPSNVKICAEITVDLIATNVQSTEVSAPAGMDGNAWAQTYISQESHDEVIRTAVQTFCKNTSVKNSSFSTSIQDWNTLWSTQLRTSTHVSIQKLKITVEGGSQIWSSPSISSEDSHGLNGFEAQELRGPLSLFMKNGFQIDFGR